MHIDHFVDSILHITAKTDIDIESDLKSTQEKTIAELLETSEKEKDDKKNN